MTKRQIGASVTRKGVRMTKDGPKVVVTRKPKGVTSKIADALLKKTGR